LVSDRKDESYPADGIVYPADVGIKDVAPGKVAAEIRDKVAARVWPGLVMWSVTRSHRPDILYLNIGGASFPVSAKLIAFGRTTAARTPRIVSIINNSIINSIIVKPTLAKRFLHETFTRFQIVPH
jgi:hypothetical protein